MMSQLQRGRTILFIDEATGDCREQPAALVPPAIAVVNGIPVARIVTLTLGDDREILSYSAEGELLHVTRMIKRS
jgi:hypothetical protein